MRRLAKPVSPYLGSEGSNPSLSASPFGRPRTSTRADSGGILRSAMDRMRRRGRSALPAAVLAALLGTGCAVHRVLLIDSEPPGAAVRLDQQMVGFTPYRAEFEAFGTRRVTLYRQGYRTWSDSVPIEAPWYALFPFDLFSEVLLPVGWTYTKKVQVELEPESGPVTTPDLEKVLEQAEQLRKAGPEGPRRQPPEKEPE